MNKVEKPFTTINGVDYPLANSLRVAYKVQGCNNHKSYIEIFQDIGTMPLEKQLEILYVAFQVANPEIGMTQLEFINYYLDNFKLQQVMNQLNDVIHGILGDDDTEAGEQGN